MTLQFQRNQLEPQKARLWNRPITSDIYTVHYMQWALYSMY